MKKLNEHNCRVCGLYTADKPWGDDGKSPTYEICPCCGVEFGNEDYTVESTIIYRKKWLNDNLNWYEKNSKPSDWNFENQLLQIPDAYKDSMA